MNSRKEIGICGQSNLGNVLDMAEHIMEYLSPIHTERLTLTIWDPKLAKDRQILEDIIFKASRGALSSADPRSLAQQAVDHYSGLITVLDPKLLGGQQTDRSAIWFVRLGPNCPEGEVIGVASMFHRTYLPDQGWTMDEDYEGKGYATEAGKAVLEYFRDILGVKHIIAPTHCLNKGSQKVAFKLGYVDIGLWEIDDGSPIDLNALPGSHRPPEGLNMKRFGSKPQE